MSSAGVAAAVAGVEALKKLGADIYSILRTKGIKQAALIKLHTQTKSLYKHAASVRRVKTIAFLDKAVDLLDFYHPPKIVIGGVSQPIENLSKFETSRNVLIEGIAGQGKSIFMRFLCGEELARGEALPLFIELRKISEKKTLRDLIGDALEYYKVDSSEVVFEVLCDQGKLSLILDGFDEIPESCRLGVITYLEHLSGRFPQLFIVVSSRPNEGLRSSSFFSVGSICGLHGNEYEEVIAKLLPNGHQALIARVKANKQSISALLSTPLLVTLLVVTYRSYQEIPDSLSGFYEALFQLLLQRHDGLKPGYQRPRRCKLSDSMYRELFDATCFYSKASETVVYSKKVLIGFADKAVAQLGYSVVSDDYIHDIVRVTCLILEEGSEYRFIHKSVQEFYAASFLAGKPDSVVVKFYNQCYGRYHPMSSPWQNELIFLGEIDRYRYLKYYFLPAMARALGLTKIDDSAWDKNAITAGLIKAFNVINVRLHKRENTWCIQGIPIPNLGPITMRIVDAGNGINSQIFAIKPLPVGSAIEVYIKGRSLKDDNCSVRLDKLIAAASIESEWNKYINRSADLIIEKIRDANIFIKKSEDSSSFGDFIAAFNVRD